MTYCRRCGAKLEENARFCHKCGTQIATPISESHMTAASNTSVSTPEIVLIAVVAVTVIVIAGIFVALEVNPVISSQENPANKTSVSNFSFRIQERVQTKVLALDLTGKAGFILVLGPAILDDNCLLLSALL